MRAIALAVGLTVFAGAAEVPRKAIDIDITLPDGIKVGIGDYHGKILCLAFILTT